MEKVSEACKAGFAQLVPTPPSRPAAIPALGIDRDRNNARSDAPSSSRDRRAGKDKVVDYTSSGDSSASGDKTDEETVDPVTPNDDNPLPGGSSPLHEGEHGSSSQAAADFLPEDESDEPPSHYPFSGTAAMDGDNTTFTFTELGVSTEQYSSAPVEAYIPMPVEGHSAAGAAPEDDPNFCDQLFSWGITGPYFTPATSSPFPPWENIRSPFLEPQAHCAFQVGDTASSDGDLRQTDYNPELSALPFDGGSFDPYLANHPSSSQGFYAEQSNFVRPSSLEVEVEEKNSSLGNPPSFDDG
ncbi:hypothetical protein Taro_042787 [Colocasia esculenta]|uniref:Uncharacterized protein n=1 Tax=Colocasia esculenta TaxID=4460 RepID=A0A843WES6_COLES|nr:hypothetical protein [Colocasia esculenta]